MKNLRKYGTAPYTVAVIHGGPGAAGEMAPVARECAIDRGILEPFQTAQTLDGQIKELKIVLEENGNIPVTVIGFSWGAWLTFILAARYPDIVKKLIIIGSGPYEETYAAEIQEKRLNRLSEAERSEVAALIEVLDNQTIEDKDGTFARFGSLCAKADAYDPLPAEPDVIDYHYGVFHNVWKEAAAMRKTGKLLERGRHITCPVVAIHGDYDPHPAEGVQKPLAAVLHSFHFLLLKNCGHKPWIERQAKDIFYRILKEELSSLIHGSS